MRTDEPNRLATDEEAEDIRAGLGDDRGDDLQGDWRVAEDVGIEHGAQYYGEENEGRLQ